MHEADVLLARRTLAGESAAFAALFDRYAERVYAHMAARTGERSDAERATELALHRIFHDLALYTGALPLDHWVFARVVEVSALPDLLPGRDAQLRRAASS